MGCKVKQLLYGIKDGIPIALGYLSVSFTFGITAVSGGLSWWQATLISMFCTTSAGQVAGLGVILSMGSLIEMAVTQFVINLRYSLMAISLSQNVNKGVRGIFRFIYGAMITDEVFGVAVSKAYKVGRGYLTGLESMAFLGWTLGTLGGALMGGILPAKIISCLGVAIYGMFIAIVLPKWRADLRIMFVSTIAIVISCAFRYTPGLNKVSSGFVIIISAVLASLFGAFFLSPDSEDDNREKGREELELERQVKRKKGDAV